jgi:putative transposase
MRDHEGQPTSPALMDTCRILWIHQAFTSYTNPTGNADTERVMRTVKEECLWLQEWACPFALVSALDPWIPYEHEHHLYSTLGYKPLRQGEREYYSSHRTPFVAA